MLCVPNESEECEECVVEAEVAILCWVALRFYTSHIMTT